MAHTTIQEAIDNRPDPTCTVIREFHGVIYAIGNVSETSASIWQLKERASDRFVWFTDYSKDVDFVRFLSNKVEG